jgi:type II secretory pathway pseudopilin PulG
MMHALGRQHLARRGLTLLEVVLAVMLLGLAAASIMSALAYVANHAERSEQRLGAYELANRLVLQYLDDQDTMPSEALALEYGNYVYRWKLREQTVKMETTRKQEQRRSRTASTTGTTVSAPQGLDRFLRITVEVWIADDSGERSSPPPLEKMAEVSRVFDPIFPRNPDAMSRFDENDLNRLLSRLLGTSAPAGGNQGNGASGGSGSGGGGR